MLSFFKRNKRKRRGRRGSRGGGGDDTETMGGNHSKSVDESKSEGSMGSSDIQLSRARFLNALLETQDSASSTLELTADECFTAQPVVLVASDDEKDSSECNKISEDVNKEDKVREIGSIPFAKDEFDNVGTEIKVTEEIIADLETHEIDETRDEPIINLKDHISDKDAKTEIETLIINADQDVDSNVDAFREISEGVKQIGSNAVLATVKDSHEVGESTVGDADEAVRVGALNGVINDGNMLSVSSRPLENFSDVSLNTTGESEELIPAKVKKRVHWADADGYTLESYNSCSSSSEDEDEEDEEESEVEPQVNEPDETEEEDSNEDEDEETDSIEIIEVVKPQETVESVNEIASEQRGTENPEDVKDESSEEEDEEEEGSSEESSDEEPTEQEEEKNEATSREISVTPDRNVEYERMSQRIEQLQLDLLSKAADFARAQNELDTAQRAIEAMKRKVGRLEDEIDCLKSRNAALSEKLEENEVVFQEKRKLEAQVECLEKELSQWKIEKEIMETSFRSLERDRDREVARLQQALNTAIKEQAEREARFQKEFETERTTRAERESQMLDDFEWKLREVEKAGKKRVADAETAALAQMADLEMKLVRAESELERIADLKLCEIELKQLKTTHGETRRTLRSVTRQLEELQVNEKILQEEVNRLRAALDKEKSTITALQTLHQEEVAEKERKLNFKLDSQRNLINSEWEEKLKKDTVKIKQELERNFKAEKVTAVDVAKRLKDQEIASLRQAWERKSQDFKKEISEYRQRLAERESRFREDLENARTNSDRDAFEMRRKIDKLDLSYQEKIERLQEQHEEQMNALRQEYEKKLAQCEANFQQQAGTTRTTIELVKQQMTKENQTKVERLQNLHEQALDEQRQLYEKQKAAEIRSIEDEHRRSLEQLKKELEEIRKAVSPTVKPKQSAIVSPQPPVAGGNERRTLVDHFNEEASNPFSSSEPIGGNTMKSKDYEKLLLAKLHQLTRQCNEDKAELQRLKQLLAEKESALSSAGPSRQQTSSQSPSRPGRRSRKRR